MRATVRSITALVLVITAMAVFRPSSVETQGNPTVNQRLAALESQVATLVSQVSALQAANTSLQTQINNIATVPQNVLDLANHVSVDPNERNFLVGPHIIFSGANVHIQNGSGTTPFKNGVGNLIVGYDETSLRFVTRDGSHNIVVGPEHAHSSFGGLVAGFGNAIRGPYASVNGGNFNTASGVAASVSGGSVNLASGDASTVSGATGNIADGPNSHVP